jgi:hypothetical protein
MWEGKPIEFCLASCSRKWQREQQYEQRQRMFDAIAPIAASVAVVVIAAFA